MKFLVFLFVAAIANGEDVLYDASHPNLRYNSFTPIITPEGFVADTPEIAAAKVAHYAAYSQAAAASGASPDHVYQEYINTFRSTPAMYNVPAAPSAPSEEAQSKFVAASSFPNYQALQNPFSPSPLSKTEEEQSKFVAASSFPNYQALQNPFSPSPLSKTEEEQSKFVAASSFPNYQALQNPYSTPTLYKTVKPNSVDSTVFPSNPLVAQSNDVSGTLTNYGYAGLRSTPAFSVNNSPAIPLAYNQFVDTPEVAAAKAAHYAAHLKALAASGISGFTHQDYLDTLRPIPAPIVPSENVVLDTPEVYAAKIAHHNAHAAAVAAFSKPSEYRFREYQNFFNPAQAYRGNENPSV